MLKPMPIAYRCASCGWRKTVVPSSNPLQPEPRFNVCPRCGHDELEKKIISRPPGPLNEILQEIKDWFRM